MSSFPPSNRLAAVLLAVVAALTVLWLVNGWLVISFTIPSYDLRNVLRSRATAVTHLDGVLSQSQVGLMHDACPPERRLVANASYDFTHFVSTVMDTLNAAFADRGSIRPIQDFIEHFPAVKAQHQAMETGFWAEFGVFTGTTLKFAQDNLLTQPAFNRTFKGVMVGFDSFEGLPVDWRPGYGAKTFGGPDVYTNVRALLSPEVKLLKGWFQDTIGTFKDAYPRTPAMGIHLDSDLFLSTAIISHMLSDRIVPGTHLIFDELLGYPGYEVHEILALFVFMVDHDVEMCAMGHLGPIDKVKYMSLQQEVHWASQSAWFQVLSIDGFGK